MTVSSFIRAAAGGCLLSVACIATTAPGVAAEGWSLYDGYARSYTIPFETKPDYQQRYRTEMTVRLSINDGPAADFQVDTGSQGIAVPNAMVPGYQPTGPRGVMRYTTSGVTVYGHWTEVKVHFPRSFDDAGRHGVVSTRVPVLVADEVCDEQGVCTDGSKIDTLMMGIGFGRPDKHAPASYRPSLINNPLLRLPEMLAGTMRAGYLIGDEGIEVGLTARNAGPGFAFAKLERMTTPKEVSPNWQTPPGQLLVDGRRQRMGAVLMDTGIPYLFAMMPHLAAGDPPPGTRVRVDLLGTPDKAGFHYVVGSRHRPWKPAYTTWFAYGHEPFVNTGIHAFANFDYLFDADGGYVGLRRKAHARDAYLTPFLSLAGRVPFPGGFSTDLPVYLRCEPKGHCATHIESRRRATLAGGVGGPGRLLLDGGTVVLEGDSTVPAGIVVRSGTLVMRGRLDGKVRVLPGARFINRGTVTGRVVHAPQ